MDPLIDVAAKEAAYQVMPRMGLDPMEYLAEPEVWECPMSSGTIYALTDSLGPVEVGKFKVKIGGRELPVALRIRVELWKAIVEMVKSPFRENARVLVKGVKIYEFGLRPKSHARKKEVYHGC